MKRLFSLLTSSTLLLNTFGMSYAQDSTIPPVAKAPEKSATSEKVAEKPTVTTPKVEAKPVEKAIEVKAPEKSPEKAAPIVIPPVAEGKAIAKTATPVEKKAEKVVKKTTPSSTQKATNPAITNPKFEAKPAEKPTEKSVEKATTPVIAPVLPVISKVEPKIAEKPLEKVTAPVVTPKVESKAEVKPVEAKPTEKSVEKATLMAEKPVATPATTPVIAPALPVISKVEPKIVEKPLTPAIPTPKAEEKAVEKMVEKAIIPVSAPKAEAKPVEKVITPVVPASKIEERRVVLSDFNDARKDDRKNLHNKKEEREFGNTMEHAELDSDLILGRYDNKQFIKTKIADVAKAVVQKEVEAKKTIADQMGAVGSKKVSVSIDETVSIKDAIMEVSNLAGIDIEIDPNVDGSIILSVKNTKVADVLERMAELAQLNISVRENIVRFTANKPFTKNYNISFIDSMNAAVNNAQSTSSVVGNQNFSTNPFNNQNINNGMNGGNMNVGNGNNFGGQNNANFGNQSNVNSLNSTMNINNPSMWVEFENGLKYIVSQRKETLYSINKQAGIVTLRAPLLIQKEVEEYIERVKKVATAQILVEVRLVEVQLNDEFASGINFSTTGTPSAAIPFDVQSAVAGTTLTPFALTLKSGGGGLTAAVQFLQTFGTTKAIASPRLNVMNNQKSKLSFAKDYVYFSLQPQLQNSFTTISGTTSTSTNPIIVQSTIHTIPVGIILDLQATADIDKDEITMNIHPVLSSVTSSVSDPAATFLASLSNVSTAAKAITNSIPVVEKKELNSTLRIKSGEIMVVGGFNEEKTTIAKVGIPYLKDIPYLGVLFGRNTKSVNNVETVIFIKATIMQPENSISEDDTKFYNDFA